ncbi:MAG: hypothetical protein HN867_09795 [Deltaproteobacteria bacterium]|nr:hypothetical protein [Deltaproteobacteria bacterium]MBT7203766.1 hypothetical protein [Deltaproteobacteria bacterium]
MSTDFFLGGEESGHVILPATHSKQLVFLGNGLLVAFKATEILYKRWLHNLEEFFKNIKALQPQGTHFTLHVYYVVKEKLLETRFRDELCQIIQERAGNLYPEFIQDWVNLPEDNQLLMLQWKDEDTLKIAIFIRNSGTEDKLSLYIQGNGISDQALNELSGKFIGIFCVIAKTEILLGISQKLRSWLNFSKYLQQFHGQKIQSKNPGYSTRCETNKSLSTEAQKIWFLQKWEDATLSFFLRILTLRVDR